MTDERMREALAAIQEDIDYLTTMQRTEFGDGHLRGLEKAKHLMISALSPPARRTSYEWEDEDGFRYRVAWDEAIGCWASQAQEEDDYDGRALWVHRNGGPEAQAIATLAGLEKEEERSVPSVRSVLAKHGLIDKVPTSGEEIERRRSGRSGVRTVGDYMNYDGRRPEPLHETAGDTSSLQAEVERLRGLLCDAEAAIREAADETSGEPEFSDERCSYETIQVSYGWRKEWRESAPVQRALKGAAS